MARTYKPRSKLIKLRTEKGFTQEQMARLLKVTRATYANYETGYRNPNLKVVIEMKKILGTFCIIGEFFFGMMLAPLLLLICN